MKRIGLVLLMVAMSLMSAVSGFASDAICYVCANEIREIETQQANGRIQVIHGTGECRQEIGDTNPESFGKTGCSYTAIYERSWYEPSNGKWYDLYRTECYLYGNSCVTYRPPCTSDPDGCPSSPVLFDLEPRGGWRISSAQNGVLFDLRGDGNVRRWSWPTGGEAFLVLDVDDDGKITDGSREMFGDVTRLPDGSTAANGFAALAVYDTDGDFQITPKDAVFGRLQFWLDNAPRDAVSQPHELRYASSLGLESIALDVQETARQDQDGNVFKWRVLARMNGRTVVAYDVILNSTATR